MLRMTDMDLTNKRVLIREDFNVPIVQGKIRSDRRLRITLPTIRKALAQNAGVILMSHLGRPNEGEVTLKHSLAPVAAWLSEYLSQPVQLWTDDLDKLKIEPGRVVLLENVRFNTGETANDAQLARRYASLCDIFVMDAFGTAHRANASTYGVAEHAPEACAGPVLVRELAALDRILENPKKPVVAIVGGAKTAGKLGLLGALIEQVDTLIVGGGIANTFVAAKGHAVHNSLHEKDQIEKVSKLISLADTHSVALPVPDDVVVASQCADDAQWRVCGVDELKNGEAIFDVGPKTIDVYQQLVAEAGTVIWNGPIGVFEIESFADGTRAIAEAVAGSMAHSVVGGGDTLAALEQFNVLDRMSYISSGGGAFLTKLEGKSLPAVEILDERARSQAA
ncbi:MAG: phosphoglycerate kinase [Gammaproteobacteria bacterium]|nr:phosphoglycerate kinase [Gammaproteobacteria bacterium]